VKTVTDQHETTPDPSKDAVKASYLIARGNVGGARSIRAKHHAGLRLAAHCGHGVAWAEPCAKCDAVWRQEAIAHLERQAAKWGYKLVPAND
jgi:hypothetical protein